MDGRKNLKLLFFLFQIQVQFLNTHEAVCPFATDLAFLLDTSGSIKRVNYDGMKSFINEIIGYFHISPTGTHVGAVSYSSVANTEIFFTDQQSADKIHEKVLNMTYHGGTTRLDLGLNKIHQELFSSQGGVRPHTPRVLLVINDGKSDRGEEITKKEAKRLKDDGIVIYALGIGSRVRSGELAALASDPSHVFRFSSIRQIMPGNSALEVALALCAVSRPSKAILFPVITQHSLRRHAIASQSTMDDLGCAFLCIQHKSCYSFNYVSTIRHCELNYAKQSDFPKDFTRDRDSVYSELTFRELS